MQRADRPAGSVLITGASSGIGEALALKLSQGGGRLALLARNRAQLESVAARCQGRGAAEVRVLDADVDRLPQSNGLRGAAISASMIAARVAGAASTDAGGSPCHSR